MSCETELPELVNGHSLYKVSDGCEGDYRGHGFGAAKYKCSECKKRKRRWVFERFRCKKAVVPILASSSAVAVSA